MVKKINQKYKFILSHPVLSHLSTNLIASPNLNPVRQSQMKEFFNFKLQKTLSAYKLCLEDMKKEAELPYIVIQRLNFKKIRGFIFEYGTIVQQLEKQLPENNFDLASSRCSSVEDLDSKDFHKAMEIEEKKSEMPSSDDKNEKIMSQNMTHSDRSSRHKNKKGSKKMSKKLLGKIQPTTGKSIKEGKDEGKEKENKNKKKMVYFLKKKEEIGLP